MYECYLEASKSTSPSWIGNVQRDIFNDVHVRHAVMFHLTHPHIRTAVGLQLVKMACSLADSLVVQLGW